MRHKVYADPEVKISGIVIGNNVYPRVGMPGRSVRVTMKTVNGCHAKRQRLYANDITRTLRPSVPTPRMATWRVAVASLPWACICELIPIWVKSNQKGKAF